MEILQKDDGKTGMFYVENNQQIVAEMTYVWAEHKNNYRPYRS